MQYQEGYVIDERYELTQFIGSGSFGEVWLAHDRQTDVEMAVKIYIAMDQRGFDEFKKEFQVSFDLNHTNLLHANYLEVSKVDHRPYLVMPFCPQGSVTKYLGTMTEAQAWVFVRDVARGLEYLHKQDPPIVHQDIKPENILIAKSGDYVITDFGISHKVRNNMRKASAHLNSAGSVAYMGPERFEAGQTSLMASDIWSLGVTIYELIMGDVPFCGMGGGMLKKGADYPDLPKEFSKELDQTMKACLALETWDRPTAEDLADYATSKVKGQDVMAPWIKEEDARIAKQTQETEEPEKGKTEDPEEEKTESPEKAEDKIEIPDDEVTPVPQKSKMGLYIGIAAAVIICIAGIVGYNIHVENVKQKELEAKIAAENALKAHNDSILKLFDKEFNIVGQNKDEGDRTLEKRDLCYVPAMSHCIKAQQTLQDYSGTDKERILKRLEGVKNEIKDSLQVYLAQLNAQEEEYKDSHTEEEREYYESLVKRIQDCQDALNR